MQGDLKGGRLASSPSPGGCSAGGVAGAAASSDISAGSGRRKDKCEDQHTGPVTTESARLTFSSVHTQSLSLLSSWILDHQIITQIWETFLIV